jgi:hypothetical protein
MADSRSRQELEAIASSIAEEEGVDPALVKAVIDHETGGTWSNTATSKKGARGLMQLMPATARELGVKDRTNPVENIRGGTRYLRQQIDRFGDTALALAAYNWGPSRVAQLVNNPRRTRIADETLNYVPDIFRRMSKFGGVEAPTGVALAFFPKIKGVLSDETRSSVRAKTGLEGPEQIAESIRRGRLPTPPGAGPTEPAARSEILAAEPVEQVPVEQVPVEQVPGPMAQAPAGGAPMVADAAFNPQPTGMKVMPQGFPDIQAFLKSQFGPLSDLADPFPKAYDDELTRLIDRA